MLVLNSILCCQLGVILVYFSLWTVTTNRDVICDFYFHLNGNLYFKSICESISTHSIVNMKENISSTDSNRKVTIKNKHMQIWSFWMMKQNDTIFKKVIKVYNTLFKVLFRYCALLCWILLQIILWCFLKFWIKNKGKGFSFSEKCI